jgi:hypothetical protein
VLDWEAKGAVPSTRRCSTAHLPRLVLWAALVGGTFIYELRHKAR